MWGWVAREAREVEYSFPCGSRRCATAREAVIKNFGCKEGFKGFVRLINCEKLDKQYLEPYTISNTSLIVELRVHAL
jgi:hypothetical protein